MNDVEKEYVQNYFIEDAEGKTMEDYFNEVLWEHSVDMDKLKQSIKDLNPDEKVWSF